MFQVISPIGRIHGPFSSRPVAREFVRMMAICLDASRADFQITEV